MVQKYRPGLARCRLRFHAEDMKNGIISILFVTVAILTARAQSQGKLDAHDEKALGQTKALLTDKAAREQAIKSDPKAVQADAFTKKVAGEKTEDVYALATKIFERLVRKYNGDTDKLKQVLADAQRDPAAFANEFTPEEMAILKDVAAQLPQSKPAPK